MNPNEPPPDVVSPEGATAHVIGGPPADGAPPAALGAPRWPRALAWPFWNRDEGRLRALLRGAALALVATALSRVVLWSLRAAGVPRQEFDSPLRGVVTMLIVLASVALVARWVERRSLRDFGLGLDRAWLADLGFGLGLGALLMTLIFAAEVWAGWLTAAYALDAGTAPAALGGHLVALWVVFITVAVNEELLFRGYLLRLLAEGLRGRRLGARAAVGLSLALTSVLFGVGHFTNPGATWVSTLSITGAGVLLGAGYVLTGRLGVPIGLHLTWNFFQGPVYGFAVSGMHTNHTTLMAAHQAGPEMWTGGAFGPEAGLTGVLATALGLVLVLAWIRWRAGRLTLCVTLAEPPAPRTRAA